MSRTIQLHRLQEKRGDLYEMDLVLRNNITTKENPWGVFHPHENLHHIKKENIGLIEVMGLAVLPARLKSEIAELKEAILCKKDISSVESIAKHAQWVSEFIPKYENVSETNIDDILKKEIGLVFAKVLEDAGVFKRTSEGLAAFKKIYGLFVQIKKYKGLIYVTFTDSSRLQTYFGR